MIAKLLPVILATTGLVGGAGAGLYLRPADAPAGTHSTAADGVAPEDALAVEPAAESHAAADGHGATDDHATPTGETPLHEYVKLNNQFVIPVVEDGRVSALVILSLSLEVTVGLTERVFQIEPKLRDAFLQVMFDHANAGGFRGTFTDGSNMVLLREALHEAAISTMGPDVTDVLIVDIVRQDG